MLLALAGGGLGWLLAAWGTRAALGVLPAALPRAEQVGLDAHVLIFTAGLSVLAGVLFGLTPALKTSQPDLQETLKLGGRGASGTRHRMQSVFVVAEMALAVVLLIGAGLTIRSLAKLWSVDPGFNPHNVLTFGLSLPPSMMHAQPDAIRAAFREFDDRLGSVPGIQAVSRTWGAVPLSGDDEQLFWLEGQPKPANENDMNWAIDYIVEPEYLKAMGIPLLRGRFFTVQDDEHSPLVVVIDEIFAQKYFLNQNPIGKRIHLNLSNQLAEIVGVVGHVKQWGMDTDDQQSLRSGLYIPCLQMPDDFIAMTPSGSAVVVRSEGNPPGLLDSIRHVNAQISNQQVIFGVQTMDSNYFRFHGLAAVLNDPARSVCRAGTLACERWNIWRHFLCRGPTHERNRHPHGARCTPAEYFALDSGPRRKACRARGCNWTGCCLGSYQAYGDSAVRNRCY
jgi:predicted permease